MSHIVPLHRLLVSKARPGRAPICRDGGQDVSAEDFTHRVASAAAAFAAYPGRRHLLAIDDTAGFAIAFFALLHAGKDVVIAPNTLPGTLEYLATAYDTIVGALPEGSPASLAPIDPQRARIDLYTSGSSGAPKQVCKTLAQFESEIGVLEAQFGTQIGDAGIVATVPHQHIYGLLFRLLWPLSAGRCFDATTCSHPEQIVERLATFDTAILVSSPAHLSRLPELMPVGRIGERAKIVFSSGGPLPAMAARAFLRDTGQAPTEVFGSTETGGVAWRCQESDDFWTPLPGVAVTADGEGALCIESPLVGEGQRWRMDDAVELVPEGRFRLLGRTDRVVKIEGKRIALPDVEARLANHPHVAEAAAVALRGGRIGAVLVLSAPGRAFLAANDRHRLVAELRRHLAEFFERVLLPRRWRIVGQLPVSDAGKLLPAALEGLFATERNVDD